MLTRREFSKRCLGGGTALLTSRNSPADANPSASPQPDSGEECDLLIKGGTVIDPGQHLHAVRDLAVKDRKILAIVPDFPESRARRVVSAKGRIVTPGWIDLHVHCFDGVTVGMDPDHYCLSRGSTTVVDAGSTGYMLIGRFVRDIVRTSRARVYALVHLCGVGVTDPMDLMMANPNWISAERTAQAAEENKPAVVGIKVHLSKNLSSSPKDTELEFLKKARAAAEASHLPFMAHINDTYYALPDILPVLRKGDIFTHCFNCYPQDSPLDSNGRIRPEVREARDRGVIFDIAQGHHNHFCLDVAEKCLDQGFLPDTLSTDLNVYQASQYLLDFPTTASMFMALGMELDQVIERVTTKPAQVFNYGAQLGTLRPGSEADLTILELQDGKFEFRDIKGGSRVGSKKLVNKAVVCRGQLLVNEI